MKRQSTISSFFTKKPVEKKPRVEEPVENDSVAMDVDPTPPPPPPPSVKKKLTTEEIQQLHTKFAAKFGAIEKERNEKRQRVETLMANATEIPHQKYTKLEEQVVELKAQYPGCLLLIEVGYKFRFFGEDARIASRVLHIANFIDRNFYVASVPVHRLEVHIQKLVNAGYRVGIVRQTETAALKAVGSNRNAPFKRELTQMVTKGTMVDEMMATHSGSGSYLMCLVEEKRGGHGHDERVYTGMVAVQPATGDIIYDAFEDTYMRTELETRLLHIEPIEILIPFKNISKPTEKLVKHLSHQPTATPFGEESVRIERMPENDKFCEDYDEALTFVSDFYESTSSLSKITELPRVIIKSLACLIRYLQEFKLANSLKVSKFFKHFVSKSHMLLNGNTLVNLEIYRNNTNFKQQGSLFNVLDHTRTKFGERLLKKWVGRPLIDISKLNERMDAVEELVHTSSPKKSQVMTLLKQLPDIEKGLCRIHYGKASPKELVQVLDALIKISSAFLKTAFDFKSDLLNRLFSILPTIHTDVVEFRDSINNNNIEDKYEFFKSEERWPEIPKQKKNILYIESLLHDHVKDQEEATRITDLKYVTVAGEEFLMEVSNKESKKVPNDWIKISNTKAVSRYRDKYIIQQLKEREQHRELLQMAVDEAYTGFLSEISEKYETFRQVVNCLAHIDCLLSLSTIASQTNYVRPQFTDEESKIEVVAGRHPIVEKLTTYVPNDIHFGDGKGRPKAMILTGPNMGGKSSYIRQIALICIMAQIGCYVPAASAKLGILDAVYTRMGASDNMMRGESTFMVELHETSDIMKQATSRSLVILDELGRGTSTHDGQAIAHAVLHYFLQEIKSITLFVTHYPSLGKLVNVFPDQLVNGHMSYLQEESAGEDGVENIIFLYKLVDGIAMNSYGLNVARLANIPLPIIKRAKQKSKEAQNAMESLEFRNKSIKLLRNIMQKRSKQVDVLEDLKSLSLHTNNHQP